MSDNMNRLDREHQLELQEKDSTIAILEQHIGMYKEKEKELYNKEFIAKKQIKENHIVVQSIASKLCDFNNNVNKIYK
jgi:hypothetical protein